MKYIPLLLMSLALALAPVGDAAQATQPQLIHARVSVPPTGPPSLAMAVGFEGLASAGAGVYYVSLEGGLQYGPTSALMCAGTKPGVTCAVEIIDDGDDGVWTNVAVYRERWGLPEDGDIWIWAIL